jgi:hypothetical protein
VTGDAGKASVWELLEEERALIDARVIGRPRLITTNPASLSSMTNNKAFVVALSDGRQGIWKPVSGTAPAKGVDHKTYHLRESAAFRIDRALGFGRVPSTVVRALDAEIGSLQAFVATDRMTVTSYTKLDIARMASLDYVIGSLDRHLANYRTDNDGRPAAIDNGCCLPCNTSFPLLSQFLKPIKSKPLPVQVVTELARLTPAAAGDILKELNIEPVAIRGLLARLAEAQSGTIAGTAWGGEIWPI